jgi:hypothetical protein
MPASIPMPIATAIFKAMGIDAAATRFETPTMLISEFPLLDWNPISLWSSMEPTLT